MSIESEIQRIETNIASVYHSCEDRGATLPILQNSDNLANCVKTINAESFLVRVIDYDGSIIEQDYVSSGSTFTLPNAPSHTGLVFDGWSSPVAITNNTVTVVDQDITIGPMYYTASGLSEFDIVLNSTTGLVVTLNMNGTKNWGDGTSDTLTTHTYSTGGNYTITCDGNTMNTSVSSGLFGQIDKSSSFFPSVVNDSDYVKHVRLGNNILSINEGSFQYCYYLEDIVIPKSVVSISSNALVGCTAFRGVVLPSSLLNSTSFKGCSLLESVVIPFGVTSIVDNAFNCCYALSSITIPDSVESIGSYAFNNCHSITYMSIPDSVTTISDHAVYNCARLHKIKIPTSVTSIGNQAFAQNVFSELGFYSNVEVLDGTFRWSKALSSIVLPNSIKVIKRDTFYSCTALSRIVFPSQLEQIEYQVFDYSQDIVDFDFTRSLTVPTLQGSLTWGSDNLNPLCRIRVPWALYERWKSATNWSTYADYIYGGTPATLNFIVTPNNSVIYVNGSQIQGTSTTWIGSSVPYVIHDTVNDVVLGGVQENITEGAVINVTANLTTSNKITISTGIENLTVKFNVQGVSFNATDEGDGDYSINVVGSGTTISYLVKGEGYVTVRGTIVTTGANITQVVTMEPATEQPWTRPNLTSNGVMGGDEFAVCCSEAEFNEDAWMAVDEHNPDMPTVWWAYAFDPYPEYILYNPDSLKITEFTFIIEMEISSYVSVWGSEDGENWEAIESDHELSPVYDPETYLQSATCTLQNDNFYSYYKIGFYEGMLNIADIQITATYMG